MAADRRSALPGWLAVEGLVFLVALALRASFLFRLSHSILAGDLAADEAVYWSWSGHILSAGPVGPHPFFMGALYPYLLAVLRLLAPGSTPVTVVMVQTLLGAASAALIAGASRRLASPAAAAVAGLLVAGYTMAILHDGVVLAESPMFFLSAVLVWSIARVPAGRWGGRGAAFLGLVIGLLALGRATFALLLIPAVAMLRRGASTRKGALPGAALGAFLLVSAPATLHNYVVSRALIPFTYNYGYNLYVGNHPGATGSYDVVTGTYEPRREASDDQGGTGADGREFLEAATHRALTPSQSSSEWASRAYRFMSGDPLAAARLTAQKLAMLVNFREFHQIESVTVFERILGRVGLVPFWLLALLALPSVVLRPAGELTRFLQRSIVLMALGTIVFFVTDRYRLQLVPYLAPFAAMTITAIARAARARDTRSLARSALLMVVVGGIVALPVPYSTKHQRAWGVAVDLGNRWLVAESPGRALEAYDEAFDLMRRGLVQPGAGTTGHVLVAGLYENAALALLMTGDTARSISALESAIALAPDAASTRAQLARLEALGGRCPEAGRLVHHPTERATWTREMLADAAGRITAADTAAARRLIVAVVCLDPANVPAWEARVRLAIEHGDAGATSRLIDEATPVIGRESAEAHRAMLAWSSGDSTAARQRLRRLSDQARLTPPTRNMVEYLRSQLGR